MTQTDGDVIYDTTPEEIGKNLFSDPAYQSPALQDAFSRIAAEPSGSLVYSFWDRNWARNVTKEAVWGGPPASTEPNGASRHAKHGRGRGACRNRRKAACGGCRRRYEGLCRRGGPLCT
ncbi:hypothetical protein [Methanoculleus chikugoensis]|uniref:hypothetical protein n=1 Tax=Methanoculleus chikugoensis TaxID=118126 RepID=UPI000AA36C3A|nr:hypothetical protein [Methanoculleus chikugoensis]